MNSDFLTQYLKMSDGYIALLASRMSIETTGMTKHQIVKAIIRKGDESTK